MSKLTTKAIKLKYSDLNQGLELMKKALLINPTSQQSNYNLACFYALLKDMESEFTDIPFIHK